MRRTTGLLLCRLLRVFLVYPFWVVCLGLPVVTAAQNRPAQGGASTQIDAPGVTDSEQKRRDESLQKELAGAYKKWLQDDVGYIITDEERAAFRRLSNDEEREQFIEQFWLRRAPDPESTSNDYKEEHYRRIAYTNQHFASGIRSEEHT